MPRFRIRIGVLYVVRKTNVSLSAMGFLLQRQRKKYWTHSIPENGKFSMQVACVIEAARRDGTVNVVKNFSNSPAPQTTTLSPDPPKTHPASPPQVSLYSSLYPLPPPSSSRFSNRSLYPPPMETHTTPPASAPHSPPPPSSPHPNSILYPTSDARQ